MITLIKNEVYKYLKSDVKYKDVLQELIKLDLQSNLTQENLLKLYDKIEIINLNMNNYGNR